MEARWKDAQGALSDLLTFQSKVEAKSAWSRGVFVSYAGFTKDGLEAFARGRSVRITSVTKRHRGGKTRRSRGFFLQSRMRPQRWPS